MNISRTAYLSLQMLLSQKLRLAVYSEETEFLELFCGVRLGVTRRTRKAGRTCANEETYLSLDMRNVHTECWNVPCTSAPRQSI